MSTNFRLLVFFFLNISFCKAQISSGEIHYDINSDRFTKRVIDNDGGKGTKSLFVEIGKYVKNYSATLSFNKERSYFGIDKSLISDYNEKVQKMAELFADRGSYVNDLDLGQQYLQRKALGQEINVLQDIEKREWVLTEKQKKIAGLTCHKAFLNVEIPMGSFQIEAWYAPDVPYAHGPLNYSGNLPGLIVELHTSELSYVCSSIVLNPKKDINIEWPETEDAMTKEEYKKAGDEINKKLSRFN